MTPYGISESLWSMVLTTCFKFKAVNHVILYGSRARGDYYQGSDIDLAIDAPGISSSDFSRLWNKLDELPLVFKLDVVHLQALTNQSLRDAILQEGLSFLPSSQIDR